MCAQRAAPGSPPAAVRRWAPTSTTPAGRARQRRRHRHHRLRGQKALSGGDEVDRTDDDDPAGRRAPVRRLTQVPPDDDAATPVIQNLMDRHAVRRGPAGWGCWPPATPGQLNDPGLSRGAYRAGLRGRQGRDVRLPGRQLHPDQIQDLFRDSAATPRSLLDGGSSSAIVLRRESGGMWARQRSPRILRHHTGAVRRKGTPCRAGWPSTEPSRAQKTRTDMTNTERRRPSGQCGRDDVRPARCPPPTFRATAPRRSSAAWR